MWDYSHKRDRENNYTTKPEVFFDLVHTVLTTLLNNTYNSFLYLKKLELTHL